MSSINFTQDHTLQNLIKYIIQNIDIRSNTIRIEYKSKFEDYSNDIDLAL
jgi:hypothetical protein